MWILVGVYLGIAMVGLGLAIFALDPLPDECVEKSSRNSVWKNTLQNISATARINKSLVMLLIIPFYTYIGLLHLGFVNAEWSRVSHVFRMFMSFSYLKWYSK